MSGKRKKNSGCNRIVGSSRCLKLISRTKSGEIGCPGSEKGLCLSRRSYKNPLPKTHSVPEEQQMPMPPSC